MAYGIDASLFSWMEAFLGIRFFTLSSFSRLRGHHLKLRHRSFYLARKKAASSVRIVEHGASRDGLRFSEVLHGDLSPCGRIKLALFNDTFNKFV